MCHLKLPALHWSLFHEVRLAVQCANLPTNEKLTLTNRMPGKTKYAGNSSNLKYFHINIKKQNIRSI